MKIKKTIISVKIIQIKVYVTIIANRFYLTNFKIKISFFILIYKTLCPETALIIQFLIRSYKKNNIILKV